MTDAALTDTSDMFAVHRVFRTGFDGAEALAGTAAGDAERARLLAGYYADLLAFLAVHHDGEELLVFPLLAERCPEGAEAAARAQAQHHAVVPPMEAAAEQVGRWQISASDEDAAAVVSALGALNAGLLPHLDEEETTILPLCAANLSPEEWGQLPGYGMAHFGGERIWLILGLIREQMTPQQRDDMLAHMPPPAVEMWTSMGERSFTDYIAQVRG